MESRIHLEKASREGSVLFILEGNLESKYVKLCVYNSYLNSFLFFFSFDFTMCNPPFYNSAEDVAKSASEKDSAPYAVSILFI